MPACAVRQCLEILHSSSLPGGLLLPAGSSPCPLRCAFPSAGPHPVRRLAAMKRYRVVGILASVRWQKSDLDQRCRCAATLCRTSWHRDSQTRHRERNRVGYGWVASHERHRGARARGRTRFLGTTCVTSTRPCAVSTYSGCPATAKCVRRAATLKCVSQTLRHADARHRDRFRNAFCRRSFAAKAQSPGGNAPSQNKRGV